MKWNIINGAPEDIDSAIINPESMPNGVLLSEINKAIIEFRKLHSNFSNAETTAKSVYHWLSNYKIPSKVVTGKFIVDTLPELTSDFFSIEEIGQAQDEGYLPDYPEELLAFATEHGLIDELKQVPHTWTMANQLIVDFTVEQRFIEPHLVGKVDSSRYSSSITINESWENDSVDAHAQEAVKHLMKQTGLVDQQSIRTYLKTNFEEFVSVNPVAIKYWTTFGSNVSEDSTLWRAFKSGLDFYIKAIK